MRGSWFGETHAADSDDSEDDLPENNAHRAPITPLQSPLRKSKEITTIQEGNEEEVEEPNVGEKIERKVSLSSEEEEEVEEKKGAHKEDSSGDEEAEFHFVRQQSRHSGLLRPPLLVNYGRSVILKEALVPSFSKGPLPPSPILDDFLFLGDVSHSEDLEWLKKEKVRRVVCCAEEINNSELYLLHNIKFHRVIAEDDDNIHLCFPDAFSFIQDARHAKEKVLVHCFSGISRSATFVLAYLMYHEDMTLLEALLHVRSRRAVIDPNSAFIRILVAEEQRARGSNSITLEEIKEFRSR